MKVLSSYSWPGNVRELQNVIARLTLMSTAIVQASEVRSVLGKTLEGGLFSPAILRSRPLEELHRQLDREFLTQRYSDLGDELEAVADSLGITLRALYERLKRLGIQPYQLKTLRPITRGVDCRVNLERPEERRP